MHSVRKELLQFLLEDSKSVTSQIVKSFKSSCKVCPNLCYLLWIDTEATLEVLRCAFTEEGSETSDDSINVVEAPVEHELEIKSESLENRNSMVQNITNVLIDVLGLENEMIRSIVMDAETAIWPSVKDLTHLLEFISFLVSCKQATISPRVLKHLLDYLTSSDMALYGPNEKALTSQKQKQVLKLLSLVPQTHWNSDDVLRLCEKAQFHQV